MGLSTINVSSGSGSEGIYAARFVRACSALSG